MNGNPELRRNLWLELSPHRLLAMPLVLGVLLALAVLAENGRYGDDVAVLASFAFGALVLLWGARLAAGSVLDEAAGRTWDGQRLASLGAWEMTWGKLLGSTAYVWYGGVICLFVVVTAGLASWQPRRVAVVAASLVAAGVFTHAASLFAALLTLRRSPAGTVSRNHGSGIVPVLAVLIVLGNLAGAASATASPVRWFSFAVPPGEFVLATLCAFAVWAVVGAWSVMRTELQLPGPPRAWVGFVLFMMVFAAGFVSGAAPQHLKVDAPWVTAPRLFTAFLVALVAVYGAALVEPKNPVEYRRALGLWRVGNRAAALAAAPRWAAAVPIALVSGVLGGLAPLLSGAGGSGRWRLALVIAGALCLALRDLGMLLRLNLGKNPKRADAAALLYLVLLWWALPQLGAKLLGPWVEEIFYPTGDSVPALLAQAGQAAVSVAVLVRRWRGIASPLSN